jgi:hypothetical protein
MTMEELLQIQSDLEAHEKDLESQILDFVCFKNLHQVFPRL